MPWIRDKTALTTHDAAPSVPTKNDILLALQQDGGRAGLQLEWMLDHCSAREVAR